MVTQSFANQNSALLEDENLKGPILDLLVGGRGENGLFLAGLNLPVILADRSPEALELAQGSAEDRGLKAEFWEVDLETGSNPLQEEYYRAILVFHYLYRPLIPYLRGGIRRGGILIYETFTSEQPTSTATPTIRITCCNPESWPTGFRTGKSSTILKVS